MNDYSPNHYKNNHPLAQWNTSMKSHNREDELQELHRLINALSSMIAPMGRCKCRQN